MSDETKISYIDERLCFALYSSSKAVVAQYQPYLAELNMTYPQYLVFIVLDEKGELTVSRLGDLLFLDSGTLTPVLKRMEATGLVNRNRSAEDERKVLVKLTKQADLIRDDIEKMQKEVSCSIGLTNSAFGELRNELQSLNSRLRHT